MADYRVGELTIVVDNVDATERSKGLNTTSEQKTLTPGWLGKDCADGCRIVQTVSLDNVPDLPELQFDTLVGLCGPVMVKLLKDCSGLIPTVLLAQPARTLLEEPDTDNQDGGGDALKSEREAPY